MFFNQRNKIFFVAAMLLARALAVAARDEHNSAQLNFT
jgi:hypothetical protein